MLNCEKNVTDIVNGEVLKIVCETGGSEQCVAETDTLIEDLQFSSLMIARLIIELQEKLNLDPFMELCSVADISTVKDLISAYVAAASEAKITS